MPENDGKFLITQGLHISQQKNYSYHLSSLFCVVLSASAESIAGKGTSVLKILGAATDHVLSTSWSSSYLPVA
jgi:hypothetical protein